ncbi:MAG: peptide-N-glycosidase F-related protein [Myxococcota bacterium]|nr:peptide-N-glycosidase F-related protein [Myxococcota bacterium]
MLSQNWSGCDSYIFFAFMGFTDDGAKAYMEDLWTVSFSELIQASAPNVHYFFISDEANNDTRTLRMQSMQARFEQELGTLFASSPDELAHWQGRVHFITDKLKQVNGSVGAYAADFLNHVATAPAVDLGDRGQAPTPYPFSFAIGRDQRWDATGSLSEYVGGPENLKMMAYNSSFYNHRAELAARLAAETDTTVLPLVDESVTARVFNRDVTLPDADSMATMDTFELDVAVTCPFRNPFACSEWDRIARISLCTEFDEADIESCTASTEIVRWITPYWRRGKRHWVMDASPFLALLKDGGVHRFRIEMGPSWERATERHAAMSVRLSNQGKAHTSSSVVRAFGGGTFDANYNTEREAFTFTPPADASRVEIVTIISGHGQTSGNNCAEWCNHIHTFTVNGDSASVHEVNYGNFNDSLGCAARANEGVVPGQWGNWSQARAGWCPGLPVETVRFDITSEVTLGAENTLGYEASFNGAVPAGGDIAKNTYIVWYKN